MPHVILNFIGVILALSVSGLVVAAEERIAFPDDAGVIDLTKDPYNAVGDGKTDCTDAIQRALDDFAAKNRILYLPNGTYKVSHTLVWGPSKRLDPKLDTKWAAYNRHRLCILQGEQESKTIIQLADKSPEFQETTWDDKGERPTGTAVIWTGGWPAQRFRNAVRNLTIDTGKGNPGAIGIQFNASNQGTMHRLTIRSGDGSGPIGVDIGYCGDHGPGAGRHLTITGFDYGVWAGSMNSMTLWDVDLKGQNKAAIRVLCESLFLGDVRSVNSVPALEVGPRYHSYACLVGGSFTGGSKDASAIRVLGDPKNRHVYCRDLDLSGYGTSVDIVAKKETQPAVKRMDEWSLHDMKTPFDGDVSGSLRLPIKSAPEVPFAPVGKAWANPLTFGAEGEKGTDDTVAIQKALDSGASHIYFPGGKVFEFTELIIPQTVERFIGCETYMNGDKITVAAGTKPIVFERFHPTWNNGRKIDLVVTCDRPVIVRDLVGFRTQLYGKGDCFVEDVCGELFLHGKGTKAWCRFLNYEPNKTVGVINDGGDLWVLGGKTEHEGPKIQLINGSRTELFGGFFYGSFGKKCMEPGIAVTDSALFMAAHRQHSFGKGGWSPWVAMTHNGEEKKWENWAIDGLTVGTGKSK